jgi:hypothetical protein
MKKFRRDLKGISTIIATIIIVAIAIVMSIAVAYWAMGIGGAFTRFEKLQFTSAYADSLSTVKCIIKNTGTATATIDLIFINGQPTGTIAYSINETAVMKPGDTRNATITFPALPSGSNVEVMLQTAAGNQYPKVVILP